MCMCIEVASSDGLWNLIPIIYSNHIDIRDEVILLGVKLHGQCGGRARKLDGMGGARHAM